MLSLEESMRALRLISSGSMKKILKVDGSLEFVATKALINRVDDSVLWRALCLHESNILKVKQVMKNYIQGKENECGETISSIFS